MALTARAHVVARPLRFAFVIRPGHARDLQDAVRSANGQWGGQWSVFVPLYDRAPSEWRTQFQRPVPGPEIVANLVDRYDPDLVVEPTGLDLGREYLGREVLKHSELRGEKFEGGYPEYGIGLIEAVRTVFERELKFVRSVPARLVLPKVPSKNRLWWEMVIGDLGEDIADQLEQLVKAERPAATVASLFDLLLDGVTLPVDIASQGISAHGGSSPHGRFLYVHHPERWLDLVDFWNLRALGALVFPVPWRAVEEDALGRVAKWAASRVDGSRDRLLTALRSRSLSQVDFDAFIVRLRDESGVLTGPLVIQQDFPINYWRRFRSQRHDQAPPELDAGRAWRDLVYEESYGRLRADLPLVTPSIDELDRPGRRVAFANDIDLSTFGLDFNVARVVPPGGAHLTRRLHDVLIGGGRYTDHCLVAYGQGLSDKVSLRLLKSDIVLGEWLASNGVMAAPSVAGRLAVNMLERLGRFDIHLLATPALVDLLRERGGKPAPIPFNRLLEVAKGAVRGSGTPEGWLQRLVDRRLITLGVQVKCRTCERKPWYSLDKIGLRVTCTFCHTEVAFPQNQKPTEWAYRFIGPFDVGDESIGAAAVVLLQRLLAQINNHDELITAVPGLDLEVDGTKFEVDLVALLKLSKARDPTTLVLAEVKAGPRLEDKDIKRMEVLSNRFPDALIVFATLAEKFDADAMRKLNRLVNRLARGRRRGPSGHVLVLGRAELTCQSNFSGEMFADGLMSQGRDRLRWQSEWTALCLASQRLHLGREYDPNAAWRAGW